MKLRRPPDFFELRLDALQPRLSFVAGKIGALPAPLVITARHPLEGGSGNLASAQRRALLLQFLPQASYIDVELRSAKAMRRVLQSAQAHNVKRIISVHVFDRMPTLARMESWARSARAFSADIFKLAVRTGTEEELARLLDFFERETRRMPVSAMGLGKCGRRSRIELVRRGSTLNYVHLGAATVEGQLSHSEMRRLQARARGS